MLTQKDKAEILIQALPYIQKYNQKIIVVKYGGNAMIDEELKHAVMSDLVLLSLVGIHVVLVHGGGPEINQTLKKMNKESKFINGLRYTDQETIDVVQMVLSGKVNKDLVSLIEQHKGKAMGLCGIDGSMLKAKKVESDVDLGFVGEVTSVDTAPILDAINGGYIPVIATIGCDDEGNKYNINADSAASAIAAALHAENIILMTDIPGLLEDVNDESTLIPNVNVSEVPYLKKKGIISGGMIPKIDCCVEAIRQNVKMAVILDGRIPHALLIEILSDEGIGTLFR